MTDYQLMALTDLRDGKWRNGISIRGRNSLTSLHKRRLVDQRRDGREIVEWKITPEGLKILKEFMPHLSLETTE